MAFAPPIVVPNTLAESKSQKMQISMQSFRFFHSFITINSIVMPTHRKSTGTTPFDSQTLGELYETYAPQLLRICLRYVKNQAEAEDVLHDAFVIIFTHIDHLRDETKLVHWMTVIVRNLALRQAKATEERRRLRETLTDETAALDNDDPAPEISTERLLQASMPCRAATEKCFDLRCSTD